MSEIVNKIREDLDGAVNNAKSESELEKTLKKRKKNTRTEKMKKLVDKCGQGAYNTHC